MGAAILTASFTATAQQLERDVGVVSAEVAGQLEGFSFREGPLYDLRAVGSDG